ncbi:hypothetical protein [Raineyella fluvialis]|uniref:Coenzyme PQQ synthesis protein D (PqqD) n=1 Tax=Raineyella fluvialis TaxID=2662261 RepID=A0A5Q2FHP7_9ACTN|nr:hypothetical protein [Raineyella fluvialis]QGF23876.1 hypothetical protein Rai3103_09525 [Raineyella fluvialis]
MSALSSSGTVSRRPSAPLTLTLHGLTSNLSVKVHGQQAPAVLTALEEAWSRCLAPEQVSATIEPITVMLRHEATPDPDTTHGDAERLGEGTHVEATQLDALLQQTTQAVTHAFIAAQTGRLLMFHAGACADPQTGAAVAYVAPGGTGKTTLTRILGQTLGYLTDETVGVTPDGRIKPYPKPLSIRATEPGAAKAETSPDALGLVEAPAEPWLRRIVLLDRTDTHAGTPIVEELGLAEAITSLAPETSALSNLDRPLQLLAALINRTGPVLRCTYREADSLAPVLISLAREDIAAPGTEDDLHAAEVTRHARLERDPSEIRQPPTSELDRDAVVLVEPVDTLEVDDGMLVLYDRTVIRLTAIGRAVVDYCHQLRTPTNVADHLAGVFGAPPEGNLLDATLAVIDSLLGAGVLQRVASR